jgi:hypothetical protein
VAIALLTAVLFAWTLANLGSYLITEDSDYVEHFARNGAEWMQLDCFGGRSFQLFPPRMSGEAAKQHYSDMAKRYSDLPEVVRGEPPAFVAVPSADDWGAVTKMRGWPAVCLYHKVTVSQDEKTVTKHLIAEVNMRGDWVSLPFGVYWPGMIADFAFYTAIFAALRFSAARVRHQRPKRQGVCVGCGYDRSGLAPDAQCPECGAAPAKELPPHAAAIHQNRIGRSRAGSE